jgi:hypothetical protein
MNKASSYIKIKKQCDGRGFTGGGFQVSLQIEQQTFFLRITDTLKEAQWLKRQLVFALKKIQNDAIMSLGNPFHVRGRTNEL